MNFSFILCIFILVYFDNTLILFVGIIYFFCDFALIYSGTPRSRDATTSGSGKIVCTFGKPSIINGIRWSLHLQQKPATVHIKQLLLFNGESLKTSNSKYMYDNLCSRADNMADRVFEIGQGLCRKVFGEDAESYDLSYVDIHSQVSKN